MDNAAVASKLSELVELERLIEQLGPKADVEVLTRVEVQELTFPLYAIKLGNPAKDAPVLGIFGGVHGLERIGTQVILSYLRTIAERLTWDVTVSEILERARLIFVPLINPGGMFLQTRSNPRGVDLMRNSPTRGDNIRMYHLYAGQRVSRLLPWYRGEKGAAMESEAQAVVDFVKRDFFSAKTSIALDVHSGYGAVDRVWLPYARSKKPFHAITEAFSLKLLLDRTYPNHIYQIEPQSKHYMAHGDLWDFLYDEHRESQKKQEHESFFLPFALELGSWVWVRKNMKQAFSVLGAFNPLIPHRLQRTLRRHILLFEFLHRAVLSPSAWIETDKEKREALRRRALELWYG